MKEKRMLQCAFVAVSLLGLLNYAEYKEIDRRLDSIEYKVEKIAVHDFTEHDSANINVVVQEHTRVWEFETDTAEQIAEEIRLGEMELLAMLVHAEAGTEDLDGKRLVADVVLNRRDKGWADGTVEGVIYQKIKDVPQFDTAYNGGIEKAGYEITEEDFLAAQMEYEAEPTHRRDPRVMYFRTGHYHIYGHPLYVHGRHYFSCE